MAIKNIKTWFSHKEDSKDEERARDNCEACEEPTYPQDEEKYVPLNLETVHTLTNASKRTPEEREAMLDAYADTVVGWFKERYENFQFKLARSTKEDDSASLIDIEVHRTAYNTEAWTLLVSYIMKAVLTDEEINAKVISKLAELKDSEGKLIFDGVTIIADVDGAPMSGCSNPMQGESLVIRLALANDEDADSVIERIRKETAEIEAMRAK